MPMFKRLKIQQRNCRRQSQRGKWISEGRTLQKPEKCKVTLLKGKAHTYKKFIRKIACTF